MSKAADPLLFGHDLPRLGVDIDPGSLTEVRADARALGIELMPWQEYALSVAEATKPDGSYLFGEVADVVARQNGKSTKLAPLIRRRLRQGRSVLHTAQDRIVPRRIYERVAESFDRGEARIRLANGQEEVYLKSTGGRYKIVAPKRGVRGNDADDLLLDEIREQEDWDFVNAAYETVSASSNPQVLYMSNAGHAGSVVLNDLRMRAGKDANLAYLEWSADPELRADDHEAWRQANPALGHRLSWDFLEKRYASLLMSGNLAAWETERLCRWVVSDLPRLVGITDWQRAMKPTQEPVRPVLGIGVSPDGSRASAALSWAQGDGSIGLTVLAEVTGDPIDVDRLAVDLQKRAQGAHTVAYDPATDQHLARHWDKAEPISGQTFANASERFVRMVETGQLHHWGAEAVGSDLPYVSRKPTTGQGFMADRADARKPITAALAAIRAVWLAATPNQGVPTVY